jgi:hypothetical protein
VADHRIDQLRGEYEKEKLFCAASCGGGGSLQERNLILILTQEGYPLL